MCLLAIDISSFVNFYIWYEIKVNVHCFHTNIQFISIIYQKDKLFHQSVTLEWFIEIHWLYMFSSISEYFVLFHWAIYTWLNQYHTVLINVTSLDAFKLDSVILPIFFLAFQNDFVYSSFFAFLYRFYIHLLNFSRKPWRNHRALPWFYYNCDFIVIALNS